MILTLSYEDNIKLCVSKIHISLFFKNKNIYVPNAFYPRLHLRPTFG